MGPDLNQLAERFSNRLGRPAGGSEKRAKKVERMRRYEERFAPPPVMVREDKRWARGARLVGVPEDLVNFPVPGMKRAPRAAGRAKSNSASSARRRYDVALGVPGAEMRLPALPEIHLGWRLLSGLLVAAMLGAIYYLWTSPEFKVQGMEVAGLQRLSQADVRAVLDIEEESIFTLQAAELQAELEEAFPEFSSVAVEVGLPAKVAVTVEERQPILVWKQEGRTVLVDANGMAFPQRENAPAGPSLAVEAKSPPPQPAGAEIAVDRELSALESVSSFAVSAFGPNSPISGNPQSPDLQAPFMPVEMVSAIVSMSGQAPDYTSILYDGIHGLGWRDRRGWEVYFGEVQDMGMKLNVYQALLHHFKAEGIKPELVSVEHVHAPYYRMER
jgi:cell division septal protein FtsQ